MDPLEGSERARQASDTQMERCPSCGRTNERALALANLGEGYPDHCFDPFHSTPAAPETAPDQLQELRDALIWMSGSADFAPGGKAHEGWLKIRHLAVGGNAVK